MPRVANNSVSLALSLLPSTLRLPAVRTASAMLNGAEVDFGFAGDLTMRSGGDAWDLLSRLIADAPASAAAGPAALQLRAQLAVTDSASGGSREIASATVPFWPLLSSPLLFDAAPVALRGTDGTVVADVRLGRARPGGDEHAARGGGGGAGGVSYLPRAEAAPRRLQRRERAQRLGRDRSSRALRHAAAHDLRRAHRRRWRPHPPRCRAQGGSDGARRRRSAARRPAPPLAPMRRRDSCLLLEPNGRDHARARRAPRHDAGRRLRRHRRRARRRCGGGRPREPQTRRPPPPRRGRAAPGRGAARLVDGEPRLRSGAARGAATGGRGAVAHTPPRRDVAGPVASARRVSLLGVGGG